MAQQTQIARVEERWPGFMAAFPTPADMAEASPADVIRAWRGLGYNRRAVGLHRAATAIVAGGGNVPDDVAGLEALPGVGPYTARAVAAIAFGRPVGAVDVNVRRVVGRIVAGDAVRLPPAALQVVADSLVDPGRPGTWTHALMDLGATTCRPASPACPACPARPWCAAARTGAAAQTGAAARTILTAPAGAARTGAPARTREADVARARSAGRTTVPFEATTRWLRGRIVDRLRDAPEGASVAFDRELGAHSKEAVGAAVAGLARDGIVELDALGRARLAGPGLAGPGLAGTGPAA